jgi:methylated-DNA-[protein]-cysteine S-methyltransferase
MAVLARGGAIVRLTFGHRRCDAALAAIARCLPPDAEPGTVTIFVSAQEGLSPARGLVSRLQSFARGRADDFRDLRIDLRGRTPFQRRVLHACRQVGYGQTMSYGELAAKAGFPRAARAVGHCMALNPVPLLIPCHRILPADGRPGKYSAPGGLRMKRRLLAMEKAGGS